MRIDPSQLINLTEGFANVTVLVENFAEPALGY
jgi:hypothetical protein